VAVDPEPTERRPIDLSAIGGQLGADSAASQWKMAIQTGYDPNPDQEKARGRIAYALLAALFAVVIFLLIAGMVIARSCYFSTDNCSASKNTLEILTTVTGLIFSTFVGLVGSVVGFYFGSKAGGGKG
jgi:hypothetical protein